MSRNQRLDEYHALLQKHEHLLAPFRKDMTAYFEFLLEEDGHPPPQRRLGRRGVAVSAFTGRLPSR